MGAILNIFILYFIAISAGPIRGYRILGLFYFNGKSHSAMFTPLLRELAQRGHQVDDVTYFPVQDAPPNYKVLVNLNEITESANNNMSVDFIKSNIRNTCKIMAETGNKICDLMALKEMQSFIKNLPKHPSYDLVITEAFTAPCYMGFGYLLKVPVLALSTSPEYPWITDYIGNDDNLATIAITLITDFDRSKFSSRLKNVLSYYYYVYTFHGLTDKYQTDAMRKYLSPDIPNVREVERSVALTLINRHPVIYGAKPITSSLIEVSGLHIAKDPPKLSQELQKWLDESDSGFVYFTFGSIVLVETLPENTIRDIYKFFSSISPMRGLIRIVQKEKLPPGLPENVLTSPWIPQQAVLAHRNIRVFITHGGLMGCQEALHFGVPMIGVPLFADQPHNIAAFVTRNMAIKIDLNNITTASLHWAVSEILSDPKYRENARHYSKLFKDRPLSAIDTAVYWVEYAARNGPSVFRAPALDLSWWQLHLLDIHAFLLICTLSVLVLVYYLIKLVLRKFLLAMSKKTKVQ